MIHPLVIIAIRLGFSVVVSTNEDGGLTWDFPALGVKVHEGVEESIAELRRVLIAYIEGASG